MTDLTTEEERELGRRILKLIQTQGTDLREKDIKYNAPWPLLEVDYEGYCFAVAGNKGLNASVLRNGAVILQVNRDGALVYVTESNLGQLLNQMHATPPIQERMRALLDSLRHDMILDDLSEV